MVLLADTKEKIINYWEKIPDSLLNGKIDPSEFYSAEQMRQIILDSFPEKEGIMLGGLEYIALNKVSKDDFENKLNSKNTLDNALVKAGDRRELLKLYFPSFEEMKIEREMLIVESQKYSNMLEIFSCKHYTIVALTDLGYLLHEQGILLID